MPIINQTWQGTLSKNDGYLDRLVCVFFNSWRHEIGVNFSSERGHRFTMVHLHMVAPQKKCILFAETSQSPVGETFPACISHGEVFLGFNWVVFHLPDAVHCHKLPSFLGSCILMISSWSTGDSSTSLKLLDPKWESFPEFCSPVNFLNHLHFPMAPGFSTFDARPHQRGALLARRRSTRSLRGPRMWDGF